MNTSTLVRIQVLLVALTSFITIFVSSLANIGLGGIADSLGSILRYVTILFSIILIARGKWINTYFKYVLNILLIYSIVYFLQKKFTPTTSLVDEHIINFIMVGIGAFTVGYSLSDINRYIKWVGGISIVVGLLFIMEPLNHFFLGKSSMETGYTLLPICIYGLLYSLFIPNTTIKILAMIPSISLILLTSRGCGLSIIVFYMIAYIRKNKLSLSKSIRWAVFLALLCWLIFSYILTLDIVASEGSFIDKFQSGSLSSSNGRDELSALGWKLVMQNPLTGIGIDGDIAIIEQVVRNYPFIHNVVIEFFLDFGIPVGVILFLLYFTPIVRCLKFRDPQSSYTLLVIALLCAIWIRLLFSDTYCNTIYNIMFLLGLASSYKYR